ncbi:MalY/PatB family protein [Allorhizocola rhizosphaerae]|uniref:MalY/PatB family protein n=1 Tax=Allorhizocola rhizosphaerae TaxID=1872709 RepID=UPI001FEC2BD1|nr:aminotransferase class I/II-fold pyridoxal phosphate-dependent enzyme [Allorhizocola rhizosphaerae]
MISPLRDIELADLRGHRTSQKWRSYPQDVLPMWVAEMDTRLSEPVKQALLEAIEAGDTGYAFGTDYAEAMAGFAKQRWGWAVEIGRTRLMPDVMMGVVELLRLVTEPGDGVVISPPVYPPFYMFLRSMGVRIVEAPLTPDGRLDPDALDRAFAQAKAYLLCNPQNPTGTVHTRQELETVAALADTHGVRVVSDEIHAPLTLNGAVFQPFLALSGTEKCFAVLSASKAWNLAAVKAAVAVAGEAAVADLERVPPEVGDGVNHLGVIAHVAALRAGGPWLDGLLSDLDRNRRLLGELLAEHLPMVRYRPPQATYLAWLDCRDLGMSDAPQRLFLERGRVALNPGPTFGTGGDGHVRLNFGTSPEIVAEGVRRMAAAIE